MQTRIMDKNEKVDDKLTLVLASVGKLWKKRKFIVTCCVVVEIFTIIYVMSLPRGYRSQVVLLPEVSSTTNLSGGLGSLASLAGIKTGSMGSEDAIYPEFYPKVLLSAPFVLDLMKVPVTFSWDDKEMTTSFYSYVMEYQKVPWWSYLTAWMTREEKEETKGSPALSDSLEIYNLTKKQNTFMKAVKGMVACRVDKKTDMVTIEVQAQDKVVAAYMADVVREKLQRYVTDYRTSKARKDMDFMEKITEESKADYIEAQRKYAAFTDANRGLTLESYTQEGERLESEMQLAYTIYSQAYQQFQMARAKVQERTPVFLNVQPAVVPFKPSSPKRMATVFMIGVLSFLLSCAWVLLKDAYMSRKGK